MRRRSLLLCFIHGFKGTDDTFDGFPGDLRALVSNAFPNLSVKTVVYPQYETRGDLPSCVANFREWLQNRVFDLEVAAGNPSPIFEPSVRTILVAHSMGGIVAADTLLSILDDDIITLPNGRKQRKGVGFMFPRIQGILAFDTPYLGLSPAMFAYGTDTKLRSASTTISQISTLASGLLASRAASEGANVVQKNKEADAAGRRPGPSSQSRSSRSSSGSRSRSHSQSYREPPAPPPAAAAAAAAGLWGGWGKVAAYAGAASILAAGGAIAYFNARKEPRGAQRSPFRSGFYHFRVLHLPRESSLRGRRLSTRQAIHVAQPFGPADVRSQQPFTRASHATSLAPTPYQASQHACRNVGFPRTTLSIITGELASRGRKGAMRNVPSSYLRKGTEQCGMFRLELGAVQTRCTNMAS
ncbi:uncharacterized protein LAJ45_00185 [Morchella importuna]|uniref:uncharacterized protein n=1 Tax=Morchella importuna TaxID=1174673 RepID=UPI001E8DF757|nr:uncharacterized protein LAJ45_00185 [Morchella importuna]KAH8155176.1 hypothetical protein LAJ45_00185 [Morchella importuna]